MSKTVLFQTIQLSISTQFSSIWSIDRSLSGAIIPSQSGPGSDVNEGVLYISQSSSIIETLPSDCLVTYPGYSWGGGVLSFCRDQLVYSTAPANWGKKKFVN